MGVVVLGITAIAFSISAEREFRPRMPEKGRFFPSRQYGQSFSLQLGCANADVVWSRWSKQIREHERAEAAKEAAAKGQQ